MSSPKSYFNAQKAYRVSLRHKLLKSYASEHGSQTPLDKRWINGFMAAGFHSGLITLSELKLECLSAYRAIYNQRMPVRSEAQLEKRLARLCSED